MFQQEEPRGMAGQCSLLGQLGHCLLLASLPRCQQKCLPKYMWLSHQACAAWSLASHHTFTAQWPRMHDLLASSHHAWMAQLLHQHGGQRWCPGYGVVAADTSMVARHCSCLQWPGYASIHTTSAQHPERIG